MSQQLPKQSSPRLIVSVNLDYFLGLLISRLEPNDSHSSGQMDVEH